MPARDYSTTELRLFCSEVDRWAPDWRTRFLEHQVAVTIRRAENGSIVDVDAPPEQPCPVQGCSGVIRLKPKD